MARAEIMRHAVTRQHPAGGFLAYIDGAAHRAYAVGATADGAIAELSSQVSQNIGAVAKALKVIKGI